MDRHRGLFAAEIGYPRTRHRERPEIPHEITDDMMVEFLALLGPDLGDQGEEILRRVARDAPAHLGPAVEELGTGLALAACRRGFLAELTEAYYLDEEEDGSGFHEDGIRHHHCTLLRRDAPRGMEPGTVHGALPDRLPQRRRRPQPHA